MARRSVRTPSWSYLGRDAWQRPRSALAWMMRGRSAPGRHQVEAAIVRQDPSAVLGPAVAVGHVPGDIAGVPKAEVLPIEVLPIEVSGVHRRTLRWATDMAPRLAQPRAQFHAPGGTCAPTAFTRKANRTPTFARATHAGHKPRLATAITGLSGRTAPTRSSAPNPARRILPSWPCVSMCQSCGALLASIRRST